MGLPACPRLSTAGGLRRGVGVLLEELLGGILGLPRGPLGLLLIAALLGGVHAHQLADQPDHPDDLAEPEGDHQQHHADADPLPPVVVLPGRFMSAGGGSPAGAVAVVIFVAVIVTLLSLLAGPGAALPIGIGTVFVRHRCVLLPEPPRRADTQMDSIIYVSGAGVNTETFKFLWRFPGRGLRLWKQVLM